MTDQQNKQKEIAIAFAWYFNQDYEHSDRGLSYDDWLLTEEGKRMTAEESYSDVDRRFIQCLREEFLFATHNYPKEYHALFAEKFKRGEENYRNAASPSESSYDLLVKISGQLDRIEGNMKQSQADQRKQHC